MQESNFPEVKTPDPSNEVKKYRTIDHEVVHKFAFSSDLWHQLVEDIKAGRTP